MDDPGLEDTFEFKKNRRWASFDYLLGLEYWKRIWILQECALAKRLIVACPSSSIDYYTVSQAAEAMYRFNDSSVYEKPGFICRDVWVIFSEPVFRLYLILGISGVRSMLQYFCSLQVPLSNSQEVSASAKADSDMLQILAKMVEHKKATNPKDYVYGILGLSGLEVVPDYKTFTPVYVAFVGYVKALLKAISYKSNSSENENNMPPLPS